MARAVEFGAQFLSRHKAAAIVVTAYVSLFMRFWSDVAPAPTESSIEIGREALSDPYEVEPLDRAAVLARAKSLPMSSSTGSSKQQGAKRVTLRREMSGAGCARKSNNTASELIPEDAVVVLRHFLESQTSKGSQSKISTEDLQNAWQALGNLYAARGQQKEASEAHKSAGIYAAESSEPIESEFAADFADVDFLDDEFAGDDAGFVSLLQTGASYHDRVNPINSAAVADAESEVYKWLDAFGQSSMLDSCEA